MTLKETDFKALAATEASPKINGSATFKFMTSGTSTAMKTKASPLNSIKGLSPANYPGFNGTNSSFAIATSLGSPGLPITALRSSEGKLDKTIITSPKPSRINA